MKNLELFAEISKVIDTKFEQNFASTFENRLDTLAAEISALKATNEKLLLINKALIDQNNELRKSKCDEDVVIVVDDVDEAVPGAVVEVVDAVLDGVVEACDADSALEDDKAYYDCLLLSDSIYRHVGKAIPKKPGPPTALYQDIMIGGISILKVIIPRARCDRLWSEAVYLSASHVFGEIIVCAGANYTPSASRRPLVPPFTAAKDICDLLDSVYDLFQCDTSFSGILPQLGDRYRLQISTMNRQVFDHCYRSGFGLLLPNAFIERFRGQLNARLYAHDGVHAGKLGIETLFKCLAEHILMSNMNIM